MICDGINTTQAQFVLGCLVFAKAFVTIPHNLIGLSSRFFPALTTPRLIKDSPRQ